MASSVDAGEDGGRMFKHVVTTESELRDLLGSPSDRAIKKDVAVLDEHCRAFIARSPFLLLATASAKGRCDVSPKGDAPGFVRVFDDRHLVIRTGRATGDWTGCGTSSRTRTSGRSSSSRA